MEDSHSGFVPNSEWKPKAEQKPGRFRPGSDRAAQPSGVVPMVRYLSQGYHVTSVIDCPVGAGSEDGRPSIERTFPPEGEAVRGKSAPCLEESAISSAG